MYHGITSPPVYKLAVQAVCRDRVELSLELLGGDFQKSFWLYYQHTHSPASSILC